jgi:hypothetical protein
MRQDDLIALLPLELVNGLSGGAGLNLSDPVSRLRSLRRRT